jgi:hypothetical protein
MKILLGSNMSWRINDCFTLEPRVIKLIKLGVVFNKEPTKTEWGTFAVFDDTCGNLIKQRQSRTLFLSPKLPLYFYVA